MNPRDILGRYTRPESTARSAWRDIPQGVELAVADFIKSLARRMPNAPTPLITELVNYYLPQALESHARIAARFQ